ncbi:hypothetical protein FQN60_014216, partial [Etheostoma spectabile]
MFHYRGGMTVSLGICSDSAHHVNMTPSPPRTTSSGPSAACSLYSNPCCLGWQLSSSLSRDRKVPGIWRVPDTTAPLPTCLNIGPQSCFPSCRIPIIICLHGRYDRLPEESAVIQHTTVNMTPEPPKDHIIWSLCCFLYSNPCCLGLAALIFSIKV